MKLFDFAGLTPFNPDKVTFGRHETFALRYGWLTKGFQALAHNPDVFTSDDATVELGVGKNMVNSIRYWLQAARIVERTREGFLPTKLGDFLFSDDGCDPYLEDEATIWLIHWLLTTNAEMATAWYWFFNRFHKPEFNGDEVAMALLSFAKENINAKTAETTLKNDAALVLRMYVQTKGNTRTPLEDALDSPLSMLRLIRKMPESRNYVSNPSSRENLPLGVFGFSIADLFKARNINMLPIENLMYSSESYPAVGSVFRLSENALLKHLEMLIREMPGYFELRETAGIHQLYQLKDINPLKMLEKHYGKKHRKAAA